MEPLRENPYQMLNGSWWFYDENNQSWGPFETQLAAIRGLLNYMEPRTRWQRIWDAFS